MRAFAGGARSDSDGDAALGELISGVAKTAGGSLGPFPASTSAREGSGSSGVGF
ncbi:hypothetical protein [Pseudarthrobacter sp. PS3-L1]|uniref:hypothetical protein n=1 Tax=Pseudarthrobacter sp. PS3-L1 TaxID=3046207 RepID=UPI0024B9B5E7|nr:hypothetical protein [Pseudarthrobacter sp. PS3-L1]MDJ0319948.1 hypothetical protein [Pseudarthrobacter sp. PS3-L1]